MYPAYTGAPQGGKTKRAQDAPKTAVQYGGIDYTVELVLQDPNGDPNRMSNGVRVLCRRGTTLCVVEKSILVASQASYKRTRNEIAILQQLRNAGVSPNLNTMYDAFWSDDKKNCVLLLEYCERQSLADVTARCTIESRVTENFAWHVLEGVTAALTMLHYGVHDPGSGLKYQPKNWNTIVHLDIKPANVFLSSRYYPGLESHEPRVVLGDFGCSITREQIEQKSISTSHLACATPGWTPPEIHRNAQGHWVGNFGKPMDIWQMGGMLQAMCRLRVDPDQRTVRQSNPCSTMYSRELNKVVGAAMIENPMARPTALDLWEEIRLYKPQWEERMSSQRTPGPYQTMYPTGYPHGVYEMMG